MNRLDELIRGGRYVCAGITISKICNLFAVTLEISHFDCKRVVGAPLIVSIILWLILVALEALLFYMRKKLNKWFHLIVMSSTILVYLGVAIFLLFITFPGGPSNVHGEVYKEYPLGSFSKYLQRVMTDEKSWGFTKKCWIRKDFCNKVPQMGDSNQSKMAHLQFACCMPPTECGYTCKNTTICKAPKTGFLSQDKDCNAWSNEKQSMCFGCDRCKGAYLYDIKLLWQFVGVMNLLSVILPVALFFVNRWTCKREELTAHDDQYLANHDKIIDEAI